MSDDQVRDSREDFEKVLKSPQEEHYLLRLYIAGFTPRSTRAIGAIRKICESELKGCYDLEVIDMHQNPELAGEAQILAAPTLVKKLPLPLRRIIGDMSDKEKVLIGLDLRPKAK
jgi:circadian clock protein KaiB